VGVVACKVVLIGWSTRVRALVLSDTHFGAWTGEDILRDQDTIALLEPHLDVDELIFLGDMFDFLFSSLRDAFTAADPLFDVMREKLQGKRFVFLAGNHDHHLVRREEEALIELELATGRPPDALGGELRRIDFFRRFLERRLDGVEVEIRYPTYTFAGVLCTHGHYLDFHARRTGAAPGKVLGRILWAIAVGGKEHQPTVDDYEATITILTALLYLVAQLPNGTHAQQRAFEVFQRTARALRTSAAPVRAVERAARWLGSSLEAFDGGRQHAGQGPEIAASYDGARSYEAQRRQRTGAPGGSEVANHTVARMIRASDPAGHAVNAFEQVVRNLGWAPETDKIVFAHTHQPLDGVSTVGGRTRYWNTGSWIYEPDLSSYEAYLGYLRHAWPGTAVLIDSDEPQPRLLRLREHLNPLHR
jgi:UDP-2,3-diacylglucosamine pyrophosphatase LpxH